MIYILDNGLDDSDHALYFVEAGPGFEIYFHDQLIPFWKANRDHYYTASLFRIAGTTERIEWHNDLIHMYNVVESIHDFLDKNIRSFDPDSPLLPTPLVPID